MKPFLILTLILTMILTALVLTGLSACSSGDQGNDGADTDAAVADQPETPAEQPAKKTTEMIPEAGVQASVGQNLELCREATKKLGGALKSALQEAVEQGGPLAAVNVCHDEAEVIAQKICDEEGLEVRRTSGKFRNPSNVPDEWEKAGLATFTVQIAAGEKPQDLEMWATVTNADGGRTFRYLKAIPTAPLCLTCHGDELAPDLDEKLTELYPGDKARGYSVGDMRGAFSVKLELPRS
jgi:hypothetical protein